MTCCWRLVDWPGDVTTIIKSERITINIVTAPFISRLRVCFHPRHNTTHSQAPAPGLPPPIQCSDCCRVTQKNARIYFTFTRTFSTIYLCLLIWLLKRIYLWKQQSKIWLCWVLDNLKISYYRIPANHPSSSIRMIIQSFRNLSFEIYSELVVRMINIGEQFSKHLLMRVSLRERCQ